MEGAGIWERWKGDGQEIESGTIVVTKGNDFMKAVHARTPVTTLRLIR